MKKILALAFSLGALTTVFAQGGYSKDRDIAFHKTHGDDGYDRRSSRNENYSFGSREKAVRVNRINREFDYKIMSVKRDNHLRNAEKKRKIRWLEKERKEQIKEVNRRFSDDRDSRRKHRARRY